MTKPKITKVCPGCGSTEIDRDATACWDDESQAWEIAGLQDSFYCADCDSNPRDVEDKVIEVEASFEPVTSHVIYIRFDDDNAPDWPLNARVKLTLIPDEE